MQYRFTFPFTDKNYDDAASQGLGIEPDGYFLVDFDLEKMEVVKVEVKHE